MTLLHEAVDAKKFDIRVVERNIVRGVVKLEDSKKKTDTLPDDAANAEWTNIESLANDGTGGA